jgi:hypothetical protein
MFNVARNPVTNRHVPLIRLRIRSVNRHGNFVIAAGPSDLEQSRESEAMRVR